MSRSFTINVECLGTTLAWDCGITSAAHIIDDIDDQLTANCEASQSAGQGFSGHVEHKMEGLVAYYHVGRLADWLWTHKATGKALLLREFTEEYRSVIKASQELSCVLEENDCKDFGASVVDSVLDEVARLNVAFGIPVAMMKLKELGILHKDITQAELEKFIERECWALNITVAANY